MKTIHAVIIDFDDTLCMTELSAFELENDALAKLGRQPMTREVHLKTWGQPIFDAILTRSPGINLESFKTAYHPLIAEYVSSEKIDVISQENYDALDQIIAQGKKIMLLTSRTHEELKHMLEPDHLLATRVHAYYYKDNTKYHKPDPRVFDELIEDTGFTPDNCVYVGDSPGDASASNKRGMRFIASLESGLRQRSDFSAYSVDLFIDRFADLPQAVMQLEVG